MGGSPGVREDGRFLLEQRRRVGSASPLWVHPLRQPPPRASSDASLFSCNKPLRNRARFTPWGHRTTLSPCLRGSGELKLPTGVVASGLVLEVEERDGGLQGGGGIIGAGGQEAGWAIRDKVQGRPEGKHQEPGPEQETGKLSVKGKWGREGKGEKGEEEEGEEEEGEEGEGEKGEEEEEKGRGRRGKEGQDRQSGEQQEGVR